MGIDLKVPETTTNIAAGTHIIPTNFQRFTNFQSFTSQQQTEEPKIPIQVGRKLIIPNHEATKCSLKRNGVVRGYAANTNQGLVRNYNEDRVSIILNIFKPPSREQEIWPKCSFFGVYDGHGGSACADFLRDNLHQFVIKEDVFPSNPKEALKRGFEKAEEVFMRLAKNERGEIVERSGSCALVLMVVGAISYVANVGDSRAVLSAEQGKKIFVLTKDHKPQDEQERKRIIEGGGQIYQTATATPKSLDNGTITKEIIIGPHRVLPGRLSVSRTFGDAEAKTPAYGGNPNVVVATPEIKSFKLLNNHDFVVLCCDGIYDKLSNKEVAECVWNTVQDKPATNLHQLCGFSIETVLKNSLYRRSLDNVTVLMVAFSNFKRAAFPNGTDDGVRGEKENAINDIKTTKSVSHPDIPNVSAQSESDVDIKNRRIEELCKVKGERTMRTMRTMESETPPTVADNSKKINKFETKESKFLSDNPRKDGNVRKENCAPYRGGNLVVGGNVVGGNVVKKHYIGNSFVGGDSTSHTHTQPPKSSHSQIDINTKDINKYMHQTLSPSHNTHNIQNNKPYIYGAPATTKYNPSRHFNFGTEIQNNIYK